MSWSLAPKIAVGIAALLLAGCATPGPAVAPMPTVEQGIPSQEHEPTESVTPEPGTVTPEQGTGEKTEHACPPLRTRPVHGDPAATVDSTLISGEAYNRTHILGARTGRLVVGDVDCVQLSLLQNHTERMDNVSVQVIVPSQLHVTSGETSWNGTIPINTSIGIEFHVEALSAGSTYITYTVRVDGAPVGPSPIELQYEIAAAD